MAIQSVIPGNPLLWVFLMQSFKMGISRMFVIPENLLFPNLFLPKTFVFVFLQNHIFWQMAIQRFTGNHEAQTESYRPCSGEAQDTFILKYAIFCH